MYMRIYILTNRTARSFAPAAIQVDASFFILAMVDGAGVSLRLKMRSFRAFQISHMTSKVSVGNWGKHFTLETSDLLNS
jgi:hypothetical protein